MIKNKNLKKTVLVSSIVVALAVGSFLAYNLVFNDNLKQPPSDVNVNPLTEGEKEETKRFKESLRNQRNPENESSAGVKKLTPIITSWGQTNSKVEVAARVPGVLENGGVCTLTLTKDKVSVKASRQATANVSDVSCGFIAISRTKLSPGNWVAIVSYSSRSALGASNPSTIEVK